MYAEDMVQTLAGSMVLFLSLWAPESCLVDSVGHVLLVFFTPLAPSFLPPFFHRVPKALSNVWQWVSSFGWLCADNWGMRSSLSILILFMLSCVWFYLDLWIFQLIVSHHRDRAGIITSTHRTRQLSTNYISVTNILKKDLGLLLRTESRSHLWNRLLAHEGWLYLLKKFLIGISCFMGFNSLYQIFFCFKKWPIWFCLPIISSNLKHLNICWLTH